MVAMSLSRERAREEEESVHCRKKKKMEKIFVNPKNSGYCLKKVLKENK